MRVLAYVLIAIAGAYAVMLLAAWRMQERIVWQPPRLAQYPSVDAKRLEYASDDGQALFAFLAGDPARAPGLLIAYHGNADLASWYHPWASVVMLPTSGAYIIPVVCA